jgi:putative FmdB family regulatory protein
MPLYEYLCDACHEQTEVLQRFAEAPLEICPRCGGKLRKLLSAPAFQFKGSGWYVSDYARKSAGSEAKSEAGSGASDAKGDSTASSAKAEPAKAEPAKTAAEKPAAPKAGE